MADTAAVLRAQDRDAGGDADSVRIPEPLPGGVYDRVPRPEFQSGYQIPGTATPPPRGLQLEYLDLILLLAALAAPSFLALKKRSRPALFGLMLLCLAYFGFYRKGCICPVGSIQNVTAALFDSAFVLPITVAGFFALPLIFALFFGRTFCAAVCPLGALQDLFVVKPIALPPWLNQALGLIPYACLALAVLSAATGADFLICRLDPFVGFFRMDASFEMFLFGACFLILGLFVARPYCRFLCPYSVLLRWTSRFSRRHATITPDECVQCHLCKQACPFGAINAPTQQKTAFSLSKETESEEGSAAKRESDDTGLSNDPPYVQC